MFEAWIVAEILSIWRLNKIIYAFNKIDVCFPLQSQKTDGYVTYVMKYVDLLLHHDIKPILVFDGRSGH